MRRENKVKQTLENGGVVFGLCNATGSPAAIEFIGNIGFDYVFVDLEAVNGSPLDGNYLEALSRAAETAGTDLLVRLPSSAPFVIRKVLGAGVKNIVVPHVKTAKEVEEAAKASKYIFGGEAGDRNLDHGRSRGYYQPEQYHSHHESTYHKWEDSNTSIGFYIEQKSALDSLDEILSIPAVDFVTPGPGDLSVSMGVPMDYDNPKVREGIAYIEETCNDMGIPMRGTLGQHVGDKDKIKNHIDKGYRILQIGVDLVAIKEAYQETLDELKEGTGTN